MGGQALLIFFGKTSLMGESLGEGQGEGQGIFFVLPIPLIEL